MKLRLRFPLLIAALFCLLLLFGCAAEEVTEPEDPSTRIVYITAAGSKYHLSGCQHLYHSKYPITEQEAIDSHYRPCSVCDPDEPLEQDQESFGAVFASLIKTIIFWNTDSPLMIVLSVILNLIIAAIAIYILSCIVIFILALWLEAWRFKTPKRSPTARSSPSLGDRLAKRLLSSHFFLKSQGSATLTAIVSLLSLLVFTLFCLYVFATS